MSVIRDLTDIKKNETMTWDIFFFKILPLCFSVVAIGLTIRNNRVQDQRWEELNVGKISIKSVKFFSFREISHEELRSLEWGYEVKAVGGSQEGILRADKLLVQNCIVAYDLENQKYIGDGTAITVGEMEAELRKKKLFDSGKYQYLKRYVVFFELENIGNTACVINSQEIKFNDFTDANKENTFSLGNQPSTMEGKKTSYSTFDLNVPLFLQLPNPMNFDVVINYSNTKNGTKTKKYTLSHDPGGWRIISR